MTSNVNYGPIRGVLFDMDGLLIDSEGIYTVIINKVLAPYNKELAWEVKSQMMGTLEGKSTEILLSSLWPPTKEEKGKGKMFSDDCPFPTTNSFLQERNLIFDEHFSKVQPMPGAIRLIKHLSKHNVPICLATSSKQRVYKVKSKHNQDLFKHFGGKIICGDDERLSRGKPFPDIFLLAAREGLGFSEGIRPLGEKYDGTFDGNESQFLVFEDAKPGVLAAKAAGMKVVWVPDANVSMLNGMRIERAKQAYVLYAVPSLFQLSALLQNDSEDLQATQTISSLQHFKPEQWGLPPFDDEMSI